jgi:CRP/FNR family transcriptional regulator, cyclic AMP receptor protein
MRRVLYIMGILNDADLEWLAMNGATKSVEAGTVVIRANQIIDSIYILLDGKLSVVHSTYGTEIARLSCGEILGEISFVDSRLPSASIIALENSSLLAISRDVLNAKLSNDEGFAARFYKAVGAFLADRLRTAVSQMGYESRRDLPAAEGDDLDDTWMENVSFAASRFDLLLKRLGINQSA